MPQHLSPVQLVDPVFVQNAIEADKHIIKIRLDDGHKMEMQSRLALLHGLLWYPYFKLNIPITINEIYHIPCFTPHTIAGIQSIQYAHLLSITEVPHMKIVDLFWDTINTCKNFVTDNLCEYHSGLSLMSLVNIVREPKVAAIVNKRIPSEFGPPVAEVKFNQQAKELMKLLNDKDALPENELYPLLEAGMLNSNQIPQLLMAYGTRSDINDTMMHHVINESALSGLKSIEDYSTEALSAKKTAWYNSRVISDTQYFARELRLTNMQFRLLHEGDCGSKYLLPITVPIDQGHNFINKEVRLNGNVITVTKHNSHEIEGHRIEMRSPIGCLFTDGVCAACTGRATNKAWAYFPPNVHIGSYAKSKLSSKVSQKVLSAKHLVKTNSLVLALTDSAKRYFYRKVEVCDIMINEDFRQAIKQLTLVISSDDMNHISDLQYGHVSAGGFSLLESIILKNMKTGDEEKIEIAESQFQTHLSAPLLNYIRTHNEVIELIDGNYHIPLNKFNARHALLSYAVVNDDMVAFAKRIRNMLKKDIRNYTSPAAALSDLAGIIYYKTELNILWLEIIVKSLMTDVIDDKGQVALTAIKEGITNSSVSSKLGYQEIYKYLQQPSTTFKPKGASPLDAFFGF